MIEWLTFSSTAIKGFPMGDQHERQFPVYIPPNYDANRSEPYPVIFMLAGYPSRSAKYIYGGSAFGLSLPEKLDALILQKTLPGVIIVFPDCTSKLGHSQYINSPALGHYMDYVADELTGFIDDTFNTYKNENYRGLMGHSSGGFAAFVLAMLRADKFRNVCGSAIDSLYDISLKACMRDAVTELSAAGGVEPFLKAFFALPDHDCARFSQFNTMYLIALAPCFAPNIKNKPLYGDLFFDINTGVINEAIWNKYVCWDPLHMMESHVDALRSLKWLHMPVGLSDEYACLLGHRQMAAKLKQWGIAFEQEEYQGGHFKQQWRFVGYLQKMLTAMLG